jgi:hypothetical protein
VANPLEVRKRGIGLTESTAGNSIRALYGAGSARLWGMTGEWMLSCGHTAPMLEHTGRTGCRRGLGCASDAADRETLSGRRRPGARAPLRGVRRGERRGCRLAAEVAPDLLDRVDDDEVAVYCPRCWASEFGG